MIFSKSARESHTLPPAKLLQATPAGSLRASTSDLVSGVATKPSFDFDGDALQEAATVNRLSIPGTVNKGGNKAGL